MATKQTQTAARLMMSPAVILLLAWMIVPLAMTIYFSFLRYNLLMPGTEFIGFFNYSFFLTDPVFFEALGNTLQLVGGVLLITVVGGTFLAILLDQPMYGQGIVRLLVIAPFFVMPTVSALVWKNMLMHPVNGLFAWISNALGLPVIDWLSVMPLGSIVIIVAWAWLPFATLIILTALQSLDQEQKEAAEMDGAGVVSIFFYLTLPHLARALTVVVLIETIFLLSIFAEILVTTNGGPGTASTNIAFLVYAQALLQFDVGGASAGGISRRDPRQYRRDLPDPPHRQEPGRLSDAEHRRQQNAGRSSPRRETGKLSHGARSHDKAQGDLHHHRLDGRGHASSSRSFGLFSPASRLRSKRSRARRASCSSTGQPRTTVSCRRAQTTASM